MAKRGGRDITPALMWNVLSRPPVFADSGVSGRAEPEVRRMTANEQAEGPPGSTRSTRSPKGEDERC